MLHVGKKHFSASGVFWNSKALQTPHAVPNKASRIQCMFDRIAARYDLLNHFMSLGRDQRWRRRAAALAQLQPGEHILDVCCGTGDFIGAAIREQPLLRKVTGIDFAPCMLDMARKKQPKLTSTSNVEVQWRYGDAESLPCEPASYDAVFCGFGLRNLQHPVRGIQEIARVLRSGGRIVILEFVWPENAVGRWTSGIYLRCIAPLLGRCLSSGNGDAYAYLPASVATFNHPELIEQWMRQEGLTPIRTIYFMFGMVAAMLGRKHDGQIQR